MFNHSLNIKPFIKAFIVACLLSLLLNIAINIFHPVFVNGNSMLPSLHNGDLLTYTADFHLEELQRDIIVIFKIDSTGEQQYIKRLIGLPGDHIYTTDGLIYVNDVVLPSQKELLDDTSLDINIVLKNDEYFCIGDNINHSQDCRHFGPINFNNIVGIIDKTIYSQNQIEKGE